VSHDDERLRAVTVLAHDGGRTVLTSNWLAADSSKQTTLDYAGGRQVRMDHTSLTVTVLEDGVVTDHVGYALSAGRKEAHYRGLYDVLLSDPSDPRLGVPLATDIARLLEAATSTPPTAPRFTTLTLPRSRRAGPTVRPRGGGAVDPGVGRASCRRRPARPGGHGDRRPP
jgi:hypothetical protein